MRQPSFIQQAKGQALVETYSSQPPRVGSLSVTAALLFFSRVENQSNDCQAGQGSLFWLVRYAFLFSFLRSLSSHSEIASTLELGNETQYSARINGLLFKASIMWG